MDIGTELRVARERKGITLRQIADATKLSTTTLQCIERNEFDRLPGGIFTKGYLRAYAAEVGVDPEGAVHDYLGQVPAAASEKPLFVPVPAIEDGYGRHLLTAVLTIAVALVAHTWLNNPSESNVTSSPELIQEPALVDSLVSESVDSDALHATQRNERGLHLEIQPAGACWVSATADGQLAIYRLLQRGERVTVSARDELRLRVGDPETFAYALNGFLGRPLGEAGKPVTVTITHENYEMFLAGSAPEAGRAGPASVT